jgi:DNA-binding NarL/FixJ family response regulator
MNKKIKIVIADDHSLVCQSIALALCCDKSFSVVGQAKNGKGLIEQIERHVPDVVILDLQMPVMTGWQVLDYLKEKKIECKAIIISMHIEGILVKDLVARGARGFLPKNCDFETLINAIHEVYDLGYYFSDHVKHGVVRELISSKEINPQFNRVTLSKKEVEALNLICADKLSKEIADEMKISKRTFERYKTMLYEKTRAKTTAGLVLFAIKNNYLMISAH